MKTVWATLALGLLAAAMACGHTVAVADPTPTPTPYGQISTPLAIVSGVSIPLGPAPRPMSSARLPAVSDAWPPSGVVDGIAISGVGYTGSHVVGVRLTDGTTRWSVEGSVASHALVATGDTVFIERRNEPANTTALAAVVARTGVTRATLADTIALGIADGVLYATTGAAFEALDPQTLATHWYTLGLNGTASGVPARAGTMLLLPVQNGGAMLQELLDGIDVRNGHVVWRAAANTGILGMTSRYAYVDATWGPDQAEAYLPLTVARVDIHTGKALESILYAPDPARNATIWRAGPIEGTPSYVVGGYVYLDVNQRWYRFVADAFPPKARSLASVTIRGTFENGALLIETATGLAIADSAPDRLTLHSVAIGPLRAPIVTRPDGRRYALVGSTLLGFDRTGHPTALGSAACSSNASIFSWANRVAVICSAGAQKRAYVFADTPPSSVVAPIPRATAPAWRVSLTEHLISPDVAPYLRPWAASIAARPNGGITLTLLRNGTGVANKIAFADRDGVRRTVTLAGEEPVMPSALVVDDRGVAYYNDGFHDTVTAVTPSGAMHVALGSPKNEGPGYLLARGPDGNAWYAHAASHGEIGRVDGSRTFAVPPEYGTIRSIVGGSDGALWFLTADHIGRMTLAGSFSRIVPPSQAEIESSSTTRLIAGRNGSMWLLGGSGIYELTAAGVQRQLHLPSGGDASTGILGCDGTLYIAGATASLAVLRTSGAIEEYPLAGLHIGSLARGSDCTIWFAGQTPTSASEFGTLSLVRNH